MVGRVGMKVQAKREYGDGRELWYGIPSWDPTGRSGERSVKYAYRTIDGTRWARSSPEVPERVVWDFVVFLNDEGRLFEILKESLVSQDKSRQLRADIEAVVETLQQLLEEERRSR